MQNIWMTGLLLSALVGSSAIMGMGAIDGHHGMHHGMHDDHYEECQHRGQDYLEHSDEECNEEYENCDEYQQNANHKENHDCWD